MNHRFHVDNDEGESGIGYDVIIDRDLMVKLGLTSDFKRQVLQWDGATVQMKDSSNLLRQSDLTKHEMWEVIMQTVDPSPTREVTEWMIKILNSTYAKADLEQVVNASHMSSEERTLLLSLLRDFEDLFDGT